MFPKVAATILILGLSWLTTASALVVNVDLGGASVGTAGDGSDVTGTPYSGQGAYSDPGNDYWNNTFTSISRAGKKLIASDGTTVTPVNVSLSASSGYEDIAKTNYLLSDYFHGACAASITELDPGHSYTLYVYAAGNVSGQGSSIKVNGVTKATTNTGNPDAFTLGVNYVVFTNVIADAAGRIYIQSTSKLNGFQLILDPIVFVPPTGQIVVSSFLELFGVLGKDNVDVKMTPGVYSLSETDKLSGFLPVPILFDFCGSNSSYDFTGVTFNIHTNLYNEYGSNEVRIFEINGANNHIFGLTQKDIGDEPINSTGVLNMAVVGSGNKVEEVSIYTRSSTPYGYGDLFGKGAGAVIGHNKHAALLVNGGSTHLLNCYLELASYGHGIFMQGAIGTLVEGCYVKGVTSTTDVVLAEEGTGSKADLIDFMTVWGWRVQPGYGFSLQEDGIRCYNDGANGLSTANTTVRNCTVDKMRSGVTIGFSDGVNKVYGCTIIGCEGPFWPGNGDSVDRCQSDAPYDAIINPPYQNDSGQTYSITLLDKTEIYGNEALSYLVGSGHNVTLWNSRIQPRAAIQTIKMGGAKVGMRYDPVTPPVFTLSSSTLNNWTDQPVRLDANASNCTVSSFGVVTNTGTGNTVGSLSPATLTASSSSSSVLNTLDGNPATYWSANGLGQWIQYDLGTTRNLCEISIQWFAGSSRAYFFQIQTASSSTGPWTTAYTGSSLATNGFEAYDFPTRLARYIRIVGQGNSLDSKIQIADLDIDLKDRFAMVKAKSEAGTGFICQNTLDGDLATRWSAQGVGQWVQYDLLESKTIKAVSLAWHLGASRTSNFTIGVSNHPMGPWTTVRSGSSSGTTTQLEQYAITPVSARFIRVTGLGNSQDTWNDITENFINTGLADTSPFITTTSLPAGTIGVAYQQTLAAVAGDGTLAWSLVSGTLPSGITLSAAGVLSGTPTSAGASSFTVKVTDTDSDEHTQALSLTINAASPAKFTVAAANVTASTNDGNVPANTIDGLATTRWSAFGDGQWIRYDLVAVKNVDSLKIAWLNGASRVATFDVEVSNDGTTWTALAAGLLSSGTTSELETVDLPDTLARFVRIVGHGNSINAWNSISEVEIWGTLAPISPAELRALAVARSGNGVQIAVQTVLGRTYRLEATNSLAPAAWVTIFGPVIGTGAPILVTDPAGALVAPRFYRTVIQP